MVIQYSAYTLASFVHPQVRVKGHSCTADVDEECNELA